MVIVQNIIDKKSVHLLRKLCNYVNISIELTLER